MTANDNRQPAMAEIIVAATLCFQGSDQVPANAAADAPPLTVADRLALAAYPSAGIEELIEANRQAGKRILEFADLMERRDFAGVKALEAALAPAVNWIRRQKAREAQPAQPC